MASSEDPDRPLVAGLRRREVRAFDEVYRLYQGDIWRFLRRLCATRARAEDLFQETWLAAARNAHRLSEDTQLLPWLYTIARNKQRNDARLLAADARRARSVAAEVPLEGSTPDAAAAARQLATAVAAAFPALAEAHREVLLLSVADGLDTRSIAEVLDLKEEAVRKRLSRARRDLAARAGIQAAEDDDGQA